jgi:hypothetical protein
MISNPLLPTLCFQRWLLCDPFEFSLESPHFILVSLLFLISSRQEGPHSTNTTCDLRAENARLKRELKRVEQERQILKEAAVFFASESKNATRS